MSDFSKFLNEYGPAQVVQPVSSAKLREYKGKVPDPVLELWEQQGFAAYADGGIWVTDPKPLEKPLRELLPDCDSIPIVRSSIGNVVFWGQGEFQFCDVHYCRVLQCGDDTEVLFNSFLLDPKAKSSVLDLPLYRKVRKKLGPLAPDEMYGFQLPLSMGGEAAISNMGKMKVREQWSILAQAHGA
jgi:hypothetical protein